MNVSQETHPQPEELQAFALGQLEPAEHDHVAFHVAGCAECCQVLRQVPEDTLLKRLRKYTGQPALTEGLGPDGSPAASGVPRELVDHPRYRIIARLGEGGMGTVYKAEHRIMERTVALKVISPQLVSNTQAVERFRQEVRAAAKLSHPNIVAAHDADQAGELHFLVMEFVEGVNLSWLVERKGPLPVAHACHFARQTALGLQHAHEQGMVHRDVKPHNLMVTRKGQLKILDFGLARFATETIGAGETKVAARALTAVDVVLGTPDYLAPEQARSSHSVDHRADLYSLGCTLYYLLTGRVPFPGGSSLDKMLAQCEDEPAPLEQVRPDVPPELAQVARRLMAKRPDERFQKASDVAAALAPFARTSAGSIEQNLPILTTELPDEPREQTPARAQAQKTVVLAADPESETPPVSQAIRPRKAKRDVFSRRKVLIGGAIGVGLVLALVAILVGLRPAGKPRVLFVVASQDFHYPDYAPVRKVLEAEGAEVKVASTSMSPARPTRAGGGEPVKPDLLLSEAQVADFDAVIFCGGPGVHEFIYQGRGAVAARGYIQDMLRAGKPVTGLCMGPMVLVGADAVRDRQITCWPEKQEMLGQKAGRVLDDPVVEDGLIVTGRDSDAAEEFARAVLRAVKRTKR